MAFDERKAEDEFHLAYGAALAAWARMEHALSDLFAKVTGMHLRVAAAVYFSIGGFGGRLDAVKDAASVAELPGGAHVAVKAVTDRLGGWVGLRNRLVHDEAVLDLRPNSPTAGQYRIVSGKARWRYEENIAPIMAKAVTQADLADLRDACLKMHSVIRALSTGRGWLPAGQLEQFAQTVRALPSLPRYPTLQDPSGKRPH